MNSRKMIVAAEALKHLIDAQTKLAAIEFNEEVDAVEVIKKSVLSKICGGGE